MDMLGWGKGKGYLIMEWRRGKTVLMEGHLERKEVLLILDSGREAQRGKGRGVNEMIRGCKIDCGVEAKSRQSELMMVMVKDCKLAGRGREGN